MGGSEVGEGKGREGVGRERGEGEGGKRQQGERGRRVRGREKERERKWCDCFCVCVCVCVGGWMGVRMWRGGAGKKRGWSGVKEKEGKGEGCVSGGLDANLCVLSRLTLQLHLIGFSVCALYLEKSAP